MPVQRANQFANIPRWGGVARAEPTVPTAVPSSSSPSVSRATTLGLGLGKGGAGLGKGKAGMRRHRKVPRDTIRSITKGDIRRLARRGGVKRISALVYDDMRSAVKQRLELIMRQVVAVVEHSNRKTVTVQDIIFVLNRLGRPIYGFDPSFTSTR